MIPSEWLPVLAWAGRGGAPVCLEQNEAGRGKTLWLSGRQAPMDADLIPLARAAVTALQLQAAGHTTWVEIAQLAISGGGCLRSWSA